MTILVFGASGQIGHFLLPRLLAQGETVLAFSRHPQPPQAGVDWRHGALPDAISIHSAASAGSAPPVFSAIISLGPLQPFARWLAQIAPANAPRVVATSSMSALSKAQSAVPAERAVAAMLRDGEAELAATCAPLGCAWTLLRPTLIYGAARDKSLTPIARRAMRWRVFPLPAGRGLRQPVHADDIALAVLAALEQPAATDRVLALGGGERLHAGEMFARVRRSLPVGTVPLPMPSWLLRLGHRVLPRLRGPLSRLESDLVADNSELQQVLGVQPRAFQPDAQCWHAGVQCAGGELSAANRVPSV